jgi:hypothetical protein
VRPACSSQPATGRPGESRHCAPTQLTVDERTCSGSREVVKGTCLYCCVYSLFLPASDRASRCGSTLCTCTGDKSTGGNAAAAGKRSGGHACTAACTACSCQPVTGRAGGSRHCAPAQVTSRPEDMQRQQGCGQEDMLVLLRVQLVPASQRQGEPVGVDTVHLHR